MNNHGRQPLTCVKAELLLTFACISLGLCCEAFANSSLGRTLHRPRNRNTQLVTFQSLGLKCDKLCVSGSGSVKRPPNWAEVAHCFQWQMTNDNWGWFLLWIILEVFDYRGHDGTADSWPDNDSSAFAATSSIDKWWRRQHWWLNLIE